MRLKQEIKKTYVEFKKDIKTDWNKKDLRDLFIGLNIISIICILPIFRYNIGLKSHYSIIESLFNKDINTIEMVVGNVYDIALNIVNWIKY